MLRNESKKVTLKKAKKVYKIAQHDSKGNAYLMFHRIDGQETSLREDLDKKLLSEAFEVEAIGFDEGLGYSVFDKKTEAQKYAKLFPNHWGYRVKVVEVMIPEGATYVRGIIDKPQIGEGLECLRTTRISNAN